jgi:predicted RNase H-like nuclease
MATLLVGFDSAWTATNSGAIAGVLRRDDGTFQDLGPPQCVDYPSAEAVIVGWEARTRPKGTIIVLDQPTIVPNTTGERPVENIVASAVSLCYGGMQPANTGKTDMFGPQAPMWAFLARFGRAADPLAPIRVTAVIETYPVLAMITLNLILPDARPTGRLPKYNPERRRTFSISDWRHVCTRASSEFRQRGIMDVPGWLDTVAMKLSPRKCDQDAVDACVCLLVALYVGERKQCLMLGDQQTGYIVVPFEANLAAELGNRCIATGRLPLQWVRVF